jgi:hypothetical protein
MCVLKYVLNWESGFHILIRIVIFYIYADVCITLWLGALGFTVTAILFACCSTTGLLTGATSCPYSASTPDGNHHSEISSKVELGGSQESEPWTATSDFPFQFACTDHQVAWWC